MAKETSETPTPAKCKCVIVKDGDTYLSIAGDDIEEAERIFKLNAEKPLYPGLKVCINDNC